MEFIVVYVNFSYLFLFHGPLENFSPGFLIFLPFSGIVNLCPIIR